jgi:cyclohexyl-isocyanide hydratase
MSTATIAHLPFTIVFALFPGVTQLDFTGPLEVLGRIPDSKTHLASLGGMDLDLGNGLHLSKLSDLSALERCSLLCVPGGFGTLEQLLNQPFLDQVARLAAGATYVASVCTGSLILGAAGLLRGKRSACHWAWREHLSVFGAQIDERRVVRDGNLFTGGGVTAGIDVGLTVVAEVAGRDFAEALELAIEYAPQPPFNTGRPELAGEEVVASVMARTDTLAPHRAAKVAAARARLSW